jgi:signal transduction histidine kinase
MRPFDGALARRVPWWPRLSLRLVISFVFILWGTILFTHHTVDRILTEELPRFELQSLSRNANMLARELERSYAHHGTLSVTLLDQPPQMAMRLYDAAGGILDESSPWPAQQTMVRRTLANENVDPIVVIQDREQRFGYEVLPLYHENEVIGALEVADALPPIDRFLQSVRFELTIAGIIAFGSILAVTMFLAGYIKRGLNEIKAQTEAIVRGEFDHRIEVRSNDEMGQIAKYLNVMAEDLQRLSQTRNEFLSKVSHELRTPLTIAKGFSSLLRRGSIPPEHERTVQVIDGQLDDLTRLVNDLLDLSRRQHSNLDLRTQEIDCGELVAEIVECQRAAVRAQKVVLDARYGVRHVPIKGDRQRLQQVLGNLIGNAARYCRGKVWVELDATPEHAVLRVRDNGMGIALEDQGRIFEPFFQARKGPRGGAGLGLTVARELVLGHGGAIEVESTPGEGTVFTILLPRIDVVATRRRRSWHELISLRSHARAAKRPQQPAMESGQAKG